VKQARTSDNAGSTDSYIIYGRTVALFKIFTLKMATIQEETCPVTAIDPSHISPKIGISMRQSIGAEDVDTN
jgi:hypothetical protein